MLSRKWIPGDKKITAQLQMTHIESLYPNPGHPSLGQLLHRLHAVPVFSLSNCETGVSEVDGRAENGEERREKKVVLPPHSPRGFASRSLQSLNYCGREKKGTACSLATPVPNQLSFETKAFYNHPTELTLSCSIVLQQIFFTVWTLIHHDSWHHKMLWIHEVFGRVSAQRIWTLWCHKS